MESLCFLSGVSHQIPHQTTLFPSVTDATAHLRRIHLPAFEGGLNLPLLVLPPSRDLTVFAPALFDRL